MMRYGALYRAVTVFVLVSLLMVVAAPVAFAGGDPGDGGDDGGAAVSVPLPVPVVGPRLKPPAIPHTSVLSPAVIYNQSPKPVQLSEAAEVYKSQPYYEPGAGVMKTVTQYSNGTTLYPTPMVCNNFNADEWAAKKGKTDVWTDWFAGWAPFAVDDGFRQAKNTTFSVERVIGPGRAYGSGYSAKIASNQPYAGGFGSPIIHVPPRAQVTVTVKYLIWDYVQAADPGKKIMDWASMGIKPDAWADGASYVNGYIRGEWAEMSHSVVAGPSGQIMVLLQGESSGAVNSNVYFDDVQISIDGEYLGDCTYAAEAPDDDDKDDKDDDKDDKGVGK